MKQISSPLELASFVKRLREEGRRVALVPTLGSLHEGKRAVVRAAVQSGAATIVSAFLNPLQFAPNEPTARYPQDPAADAAASRSDGATAAFMPAAEDMLPRGFSTYVSEETLSRKLCGPSRPGHFRGVTTMTAKLMNLVGPDQVYFGEKTVQRAVIVRKMVADLGYPAEVVVVPTAREPDGLAWATVNRTFTESQRKEALALIAALRKAREMTAAGTRSPDRLVAEATHILAQHRRVRTIYISVVDSDTLEPTREVRPGRDLLALAAWVDEARLIDNIRL